MKRYGEGTRMRRYTLLDDRRPHKAILFKYYPDTALTKVSISSQCAEVFLKGLHKIHATYVLHGDVNSRNILLMPDNRVMWCDFDESTCGSETVWRKKLTREKLLSELKLGWDLLYPSLVGCAVLYQSLRSCWWYLRDQFPDKYCDFSSWLY